jgi:hypothetical protein
MPINQQLAGELPVSIITTDNTKPHMSRNCTNFKGWMGDSTLNVCAASAPHSEMEFVSNPAVVQHAEQRDASAHLLVLQMQHQQQLQ